jgi:hypothetical protein
MPRTKFSTIDLNQLRQQLEHWRQCHSGRIRLPEALWTAAVTLATTHGVGPVARTLRLDYNKLKRQMHPAAGHFTPSAPPTFVELPLAESLPRPATWCRVELSDGAGSKMTMELPCDASTVTGLVQAFWRRA